MEGVFDKLLDEENPTSGIIIITGQIVSLQSLPSSSACPPLGWSPLSYGFHVVTRNNRDENGAMGNGVSLLEHRRNEEILEEAKVEQIATVMRSRRLEWFGHVKRRDETENIRAVVEMKMEGKRPRGRPKLTWKDAVRRDMKPGATGSNGPLTVRDGKVCARPATPHRETVAKGEKHALSIGRL